MPMKPMVIWLAGESLPAAARSPDGSRNGTLSAEERRKKRRLVFMVTGSERGLCGAVRGRQILSLNAAGCPTGLVVDKRGPWPRSLWVALRWPDTL